MSVSKIITLTEQGISSGPTYSVSYSDDCVTYTFLSNVNLTYLGQSVTVSVPDNTQCIKLTSTGVCTNEVVDYISTISTTTTTTTAAPTTTTTQPPTTTTTTTAAPTTTTTTTTAAPTTTTTTTTAAPTTTTTTTTTTTAAPTTTTTTSTTTTTTAAPTTTTTTTETPTTTTTTTTVPPVEIVSNGLTSWQNCDSYSGSIWYDKSGNGNSALVSGSTLVLSGSLGLEFNGTNNFITYQQPLTATPSGSWTLQWYGTMYNDSTNRDLFCKDFYNDGWDTIWEPVLTRLTYRDVAGNDKTISVTNVSAEKALWTLLGNDSANRITVYKNTTLLGTMSGGAVNAFNVSSSPLKFGWNSNSDATFFKGTIQDLIVYNRELDGTEITTNYNVLSNKVCPGVTTTTTTTTTETPTTTTTTTAAPTTTTTTTLCPGFQQCNNYRVYCNRAQGNCTATYTNCNGDSAQTSVPQFATSFICSIGSPVGPGIQVQANVGTCGTYCPTTTTTTTAAPTTTTTTTIAVTYNYYDVTRFTCPSCTSPTSGFVARNNTTGGTLITGNYYNNGDGYVYRIDGYNAGSSYTIDLDSVASAGTNCSATCAI